ncbi:MAG: helix-turn-helix transcriptional regulator [Clostridia bacterium]|nr:helix-turn-helix transcriptional regulator [Clostridia bacterium]
MIKLNVLKLLEQTGQTPYGLFKQMGMSYTNFTKMIQNETKSISYKNIEALCTIFQCTPNELLEYYDDKTGEVLSFEEAFRKK